MDKFFDKVGLYDIWTVLFPGVIFQIGIRSLYNFMTSLPQLLSVTPGAVAKLGIFLQMDVVAPSNIFELLVLLTISYLSGLILHELSSFFKHNFVYRNGDPRTLLLNETTGPFNSQELYKLMPLLKSLNDDKDFSAANPEKLREESKFLFHRMNKKLQDIRKAGEYVKLNIIYNMCSTLCMVLTFFSLIVIAFGIEFLFLREISSFIYSIILLGMMIFLLLILFFRSKRYFKYWVRNIVFAYEDLYRNNKDNSMTPITSEQSES